MLTILTSDDDATSDFFCEFLDAEKADYNRLNVNTLVSSNSIMINNNTTDYTIGTNRHKLYNNGIVWYRRPSPPKLARFNSDEREFLYREWLEIIDAISLCLCDSIWINWPYNNSLADNKIYQMRIADKCGFNVPLWILTNSYSDIYEFVMLHQSLVKPLSYGSFGLDESMAIYSTILNPTDIEENKVSHTPVLFQKVIHKAYDVRVTVFGDKVFAHKICPKDNFKKHIDWRAYEPNRLIMSDINIPESVEVSIMKLMLHFKLRFSAIDFSVTEKNIWYFLDLNPNGQWGWLEIACNTPMRRSFYDHILSLS
ncbi:hypothetical protein KQI52_09780 [bacterium]|nr:hypothetical protein [bacterium]